MNLRPALLILSTLAVLPVAFPACEDSDESVTGVGAISPGMGEHAAALVGAADGECSAAPAGCDGSVTNDAEFTEVSVGDATATTTYTIEVNAGAEVFPLTTGASPTIEELALALAACINTGACDGAIDPSELLRAAASQGPGGGGSLLLFGLDAGTPFDPAVMDGGTGDLGAPVEVRAAGGDVDSLLTILSNPLDWLAPDNLGTAAKGSGRLPEIEAGDGAVVLLRGFTRVNCNSNGMDPGDAGEGTITNTLTASGVVDELGAFRVRFAEFARISFSNCTLTGDYAGSVTGPSATLNLRGSLTFDESRHPRIVVLRPSVVSGSTPYGLDIDGTSCSANSPAMATEVQVLGTIRTAVNNCPLMGTWALLRGDAVVVYREGQADFENPLNLTIRQVEAAGARQLSVSGSVTLESDDGTGSPVYTFGAGETLTRVGGSGRLTPAENTADGGLCVGGFLERTASTTTRDDFCTDGGWFVRPQALPD